MSKILVTGGAGLIGSFVVRKLLELGHQPIVFDSFTQYTSPLKNNYQKYIKLRFKDIEDSVIFERGTTVDREDLFNVITKHKPTKVIHLAAIPIADDILLPLENIFVMNENTKLFNFIGSPRYSS